MRSNFDKQLDTLNTQLTDMSNLVEKAIECTTHGLVFADRQKAEMAVEYDAEVDVMEKDIEKLCVKLLLLQQPVAKDLRQISAALKMITDLERIGDQARDISELVLRSEHTVTINPDGVISKMET
ncbi:MAG: phosphate transport system regulatory protein PhoU, partial [Oscillospiraceae bacterium]|nr:phosphate transport system regulatory protein PhoU [Oscillospiraceae bacterium]